MKEKEKKLRLYNFSHPMMGTEVLSIMGDKYSGSLPFTWEFTRNYEEAEVVLWDGVLSPRINPLAEKILIDAREKKVLLLIGESETLFQNHPIARTAEHGDRVVVAGGWSILPEDLLDALEKCFQKIHHV